MSTRQIIPLTTALMGLYIIVMQRRWRVGLAMVTLSASGSGSVPMSWCRPSTNKGRIGSGTATR